MKSKESTQYTTVDATPVKSFFVSMLTRDIRLEEAILDLLDNCIDGVTRQTHNRNLKRPYSNYWADIVFNEKQFSIHDNCGGIPWSLHDYAFRMGRSDERPVEDAGTVGVYGIGMKRAIFKMGKHCTITTKNKADCYTVEISSDWISDESAWKIPVRKATEPMPYDGTQIEVKDLHSGVSSLFQQNNGAFETDLYKLISTHYAFIIDRGFKITLNGKEVEPKPTRLHFTEQKANKTGINPFIYKAKSDNGVDIYLAIGLTQPIPSTDDVMGEQEEKRFSSLDAGWTVVCNGRTVIYCDKTELTGWGEALIPRYHTQFIAISGIVEFRSDDPSKLPTTTTKRGIDASSPIYLQVKNKMREGMRQFTDLTNKWKRLSDDLKSTMKSDNSKAISLEELKAQTSKFKFHTVRNDINHGSQFKPDLPVPKELSQKMKRITFTKTVEDVSLVAKYFVEDEDVNPSKLGEKCFDLVLSKASK